MVLDNEKIIAALEPPVSHSQSGKMAEMAVSTRNLARSGQQSFTTVKRKKEKIGVIVAEVVDASQLDAFGTSEPAKDAGRGRELLSSPRDHPQLTAKHEAVEQSEKRAAFDKSVGNVSSNTSVNQSGLDASRASMGPLGMARSLKDQSKGTQDSMSEAAIAAQAVKDKIAYMMASSSDSDDDPKKRIRPSGCFRTVARDRFDTGNMETPGVGHYRPRHNVVERRATAVKFQRAGFKRKKKGSPRRRPDSADSGRSSPLERSMAASVPLTEPSNPSSPTKSKSGNFGYSRSESMMSDYPVDASMLRGSPAFMSTVPNRPPVREASQLDTSNADDRCLSTVSKPKGAVRFSRMVEREKTRHKGTWSTGCAPDVVYTSKAEPPRPKADYNWDRQPVRTTNISDRPDYAAKHMVYDTDYRTKNTPTPDFTTYAGRDRTAVALQRAAQFNVTGDYHFVETERVGGKRSGSAIPFDKQTPRPEFLQNKPQDVDYNPRFTLVKPSSQSPDISIGRPHDIIMGPNLTKNCTYDPDVSATRPATKTAGDLSRVTGRETVPVGVGNTRPLDRFYDTDTNTTVTRTVGNPLMRSHLSRDARNKVKEPKAGIDQFYDVNVETVMPRTTGRGDLDFGKSLPRNKRGPSRVGGF